MENFVTKQDAIEWAIESHKKVLLHMKGVAEHNKVTLFHPYAMVRDLFNGLALIGRIEKANSAPGSMVWLKSDNLLSVELLDVNFEPSQQLWQDFTMSGSTF